MRRFLYAFWQLISSNAITTRQTSNKFGLLSLLWQFCKYLFVPERLIIYQIMSSITDDNVESNIL